MRRSLALEDDIDLRELSVRAMYFSSRICRGEEEEKAMYDQVSC